MMIISTCFDQVLTKIVLTTFAVTCEINYHPVKENLNYAIEARNDGNVCKLNLDEANSFILNADEAW